MRWLALGLVAVLIVALTWWKVSSRHVVALQQMPSELSATVAPAAPTQGPVASSVAGSSSYLTPQETVARSHARHEASRTQAAEIVTAGHNKLLSRYQSEHVDPRWAHDREQSLVAHSVNQQIKDLKAEPKNMTVHCRTTTCAIEADFATPGAADDWLTLYATNPGTDLFNLSSQVTANADGSAHIQIYGLAKQ